MRARAGDEALFLDALDFDLAAMTLSWMFDAQWDEETTRTIDSGAGAAGHPDARSAVGLAV
jgi:hypothetical protein